MNHVGLMLTVALIIGMLVGVVIGVIVRVPQQQVTEHKPSARLTRAAAESAAANTFDHLAAVGKALTPMQVDRLSEALAMIDDAREDAPLGSPVRAALDRLHAEADALVSASVK